MFPPMELQAEGELQIRITEDRAIRRTQSKELAEKMGLTAASFKNLSTPEAMLSYLRDTIKTQSRENQERIRQIGEHDVATRLAATFMPDPDRYYLKAMNCPHHHKLFAAVPRSYRDPPLRLAGYGTDYRYEKSGEFFSLMGGRPLHMKDAHI